jgi:putative ABC transport system substrate-binding protein
MGIAPGPVGQTAQATFIASMAELGWRNGENIEITFHWTSGNVERAKVLAHEIVALRPEVIVGHTTPCVAALLSETEEIPIIFVIVSDPVGSGFVKSLAEPGGTVTGFINLEAALSAKWLGLLMEVSPQLRHAGMLYNPAAAPRAGMYYLNTFEAAAKDVRVISHRLPVNNPEEIDRAFGVMRDAGDAGVIIMPDGYIAARLADVISSAQRHAVPAVYPYRFMAAAGGLLSYGVDNLEFYPQAARYVDRVLKGAKPADLPVQHPTKFELAVNTITAKALGLEFPPLLLARADEVIE